MLEGQEELRMSLAGERQIYPESVWEWLGMLGWNWVAGCGVCSPLSVTNTVDVIKMVTVVLCWLQDLYSSLFLNSS